VSERKTEPTACGADLLRRAADKLRASANAASWGPWEVGPTFGARDNTVYVRPEGGFDWVGSTYTDRGDPPKVMTCQVSNVPQFRANAAYIVLMHPPVALALAEWLESEARLYASNIAAFVVALAVLREDGAE
jgi:hypothetical protein